jgi:hypothetical protein
MRSIIYAAAWLIVGFGFTEFVADCLVSWRVRPQQVVVDAGVTLADSTAPTPRFVESSPHYRPGRPSTMSSTIPSALASPSTPVLATLPVPTPAPPAVRWE